MNERNKLEVIPFSSISERSFKDNFLSIDELYLADNGEYAIPYVVDPMVLFYNRANLATIGVGQVPTSWEVILGLTPQLTKRTNANVILKSAIAFGTYDNIPNARGIVSLLLLQAGNKIAQVGAQGLRTTLSAGSDEFSRSPGESAIAFYTQFADPAKVVYSWNRSLSDARQSFIAGDSTFYVGYASERQLLSQANPNLNFDMTLVPQPQTSSVHIDYALAYAFAIPKGSPNSQGAFRTAEALASNPEIVITTQRLGVASALRSQPMAQGDIYAPIVNAAALTAAGWLSPAPGVTDRIFSSMINSIISGQATIHDALVTADESFSASY